MDSSPGWLVMSPLPRLAPGGPSLPSITPTAIFPSTSRPYSTYCVLPDHTYLCESPRTLSETLWGTNMKTPEVTGHAGGALTYKQVRLCQELHLTLGTPRSPPVTGSAILEPTPRALGNSCVSDPLQTDVHEAPGPCSLKSYDFWGITSRDALRGRGDRRIWSKGAPSVSRNSAP